MAGHVQDATDGNKNKAGSSGESEEEGEVGSDKVDSAELRLRVQELEGIRKALERDLASLRATAQGEERAGQFDSLTIDSLAIYSHLSNKRHEWNEYKTFSF